MIHNTKRRDGNRDCAYEIKHRASLPGYDWPIRWEHERGDASDEARAGALRAEPASRSQAQPLVAIAGGKR